MKIKPVWTESDAAIKFPSLAGDIDVDVAIIGGGITGITAAQLLAVAGKKVAVLEAGRIAGSSTGNSTGNLYAPTGDRLHKIESNFGKEAVRKVVESRAAAIDFTESNVRSYNIDCDFVRVPWYLFSSHYDTDKTIEQERKAAEAAGLKTSADIPENFPFKVRDMLRIDGQAQFNPLTYVRQLAQKIQSDNCLIYEQTKAEEVERGEPCRVHTNRGVVTAKQVIMATHTPKGIYGVHSAMGPYREYALAVKLNSPVPAGGIYWEMQADQMKHQSMRPYTTASVSWMMALGGSHKVGHEEDNEKKFKEIEQNLRERFEVASIDYTWAAQNYKPADHVPYIGPDGKNSPVYIATGFAADGLTYGTVAAMIITDQITGKENKWADVYDANRVTPVASAMRFAKENADVAFQFGKDWILPADAKELSDIPKGEGKTVTIDGRKCAAYRDSENRLHVVSAVCTHMGCIVHWNSAETSWDCPCHGSRFAIDGEVLEGPAIGALPKKNPN